MDNKTDNTSRVSGLTGIPIRTIQDYVRDFRDQFSEGARQRSKGRQFTDADRKTLLTIKRARSERIPDEEIRKIISGESVLPLANEYNEQDIKKMVIQTCERFDLVMTVTENYESFLTEAKEAFAKLKEDNHRMRDEITTLKTTLESIRKWRVHVMTTDPGLNNIIDHELEKELGQDQKTDPPLKKSLFEKLIGN